MTSDMLAFFAPSIFEVLIVLFILALPAALVVLVVIYVLRGSKEREKLHQKMDELANELKQTQEHLKEQKKDKL